MSEQGRVWCVGCEKWISEFTKEHIYHAIPIARRYEAEANAAYEHEKMRENLTALEREVVDAAMDWFHWHGYIPNLAAAHYEKPLIAAVKALKETDPQWDDWRPKNKNE